MVLVIAATNALFEIRYCVDLEGGVSQDAHRHQNHKSNFDSTLHFELPQDNDR